MTREEAIAILTETEVVYFAPNGKQKAQEALDMAIEALRSDAVSREEYEEVKAYMDTLVDAFIEDGEELAESVKVVRCKDCKHLNTAIGAIIVNGVKESVTYDYWCNATYPHVTVQDTEHFCSYGERREE